MELIIKETLEKLLAVMGISFSSIKIQKEGECAYYVEIESEYSNRLIGWHGETLAALQHMLKCLLFQQGLEGKMQLVLDVDGYKKRQEESVLFMAEQKADRAIESKKMVILPPMNPYFRRKIHLHLANSEKYKDAVTTESVGFGDERQVKIIPK